MNWRPADDGVTHINVYSKGNTELGRLLSNWADTPFRIPLHGAFRTVEGFWFWTITGREEFREMSGWECKLSSEDYPRKRSSPSARELLIAYRAKLKAHPHLAKMLSDNPLPLAHYYVYGGKPVQTKWEWTARLWDRLK